MVQLINKQGGKETEASPLRTCEAATGRHFTEQDEAVIGTFLSLLGPHIFTSSILKFTRHPKVSLSLCRTHIRLPDDNSGYASCDRNGYFGGEVVVSGLCRVWMAILIYPGHKGLPPTDIPPQLLLNKVSHIIVQSQFGGMCYQ